MEKFHHKTPYGEIVIPKFKHVPAGVIRATRRSSQADQIFTALESFKDEKALAVVDQLTSEELNDFVKAWQSDSGVTAGESPAS
jgi:hypothetical protein